LTDSGFNPRNAKPAPIDDPKVDQFKLRNGDFIISRSNTPEKVGRTALFKGEIKNCSYPDLMMKFRINEEVADAGFIEKLLSSKRIQQYYKSHSAGSSSTMVKINKATVKKTPVFLPPLPEQKAIADLLLTWDITIEKTERLIAAKEKRFKWLLKKLITEPQEKQNGIKWEKVKLSSICKIADKQKLTSLENHFLLTVKLHCLGIERNNRIKPRLTKNGRPYCQHKSGDFLIGRQNFHNGGFGIISTKLDGGITSNAISCLIVKESKLSKTFLWYQFSNPNYYKKIGHVMDGTGQKELSEKQILKLQVRLPSLKEQERIAKMLNIACKEIDLHKKQLAAFKELKHGLMQKLLTGQWRVKVSEEVA